MSGKESLPSQTRAFRPNLLKGRNLHCPFQLLFTIYLTCIQDLKIATRTYLWQVSLRPTSFTIHSRISWSSLFPTSIHVCLTLTFLSFVLLFVIFSMISDYALSLFTKNGHYPHSTDSSLLLAWWCPFVNFHQDKNWHSLWFELGWYLINFERLTSVLH